MNIKSYFSNYKALSYAKLKSDASHKETIENFYEDFIREHLEKFFVTHKSNLLKWCALLEDYANSPLPIFWIRKFESGGGKDVNDNRRTATTVLVDASKTAVAAYAYISNYDVQELYNMLLHVDDPMDFSSLMKDGDYAFHYDNGKASTESIISSFQNLAHARNPGVFNAANLYLAHIVDVNGEYPAPCHTFEKGDVSEWNEKASYAGHTFFHIFSGDPTKKVRVLEYTDDPAALRLFLKAHFFRFVHPFNYYLVPGQSYEINAIFGKTQTSVGEHSDLTNYVKYRMYRDYIKHDAELRRYYAAFETIIQIEDSDKLSVNFTALEDAYRDLGSKTLHIVYGTAVGKEGQLLQRLRKKITNADDLQNLYEKKYDPGDQIVFCDAAGDVKDSFRPENVGSFEIFLEKLNRKVEPKANLKVDVEKCTSAKTGAAPKAKSPRAAKAKAGSAGSKYSEKKRLELAKYYLEHTTGLVEAEAAILGRNNSGSTAKGWLNELHIDTGRNSKHKGLLCKSGSCIDDEIAKATDPVFQKTLEAIRDMNLLAASDV